MTSSRNVPLETAVSEQCPEGACLQSFLDGRLEDAQCETISLHLEVCPTCIATLMEIDHRKAALRQDAIGCGLATDQDGLQRAIACAIDVPNKLPSRESRFQSGMLVDGYRLRERLGCGGMGEVFLAEHKAMRRQVALKVLSSRTQDDPEFARRFVHEIRTSAKLDHPRFVKSLDAGEFNGSPYLVMEHLPGISLSLLSQRWGRLSVNDTCEIARQIAEGMQVLADQKLVHRDLKPSNMMLVSTTLPSEPQEEVVRSTTKPTIKILDFGVARWQESSGVTQVGTQAGLIVGTLEYMAPEQLESSSQVDERSDWYSLGAMLFKLLIGAAPLELGDLADASPITKAAHLKTESAPPIRSFRRDIPRTVARIVDRLLSRDPAQRPSPSEVQRVFASYAADADLRRLLRELPEQTDSAPITRQQTSRFRLRKGTIQRNARWLAAIVTLLLGAIFFATDYGDLSIEVLDDDTKVVVSRGGKVIEIIDTREKRRVRLRPDKYKLAIENADNRLLDLSTNEVTIRRGVTEIARVSLQPQKVAATAPAPQQKPSGLSAVPAELD